MEDAEQSPRLSGRTNRDAAYVEHTYKLRVRLVAVNLLDSNSAPLNAYGTIAQGRTSSYP